MSSICSPNFQFTLPSFDKVTYVTGSYRLMLQRTECKHSLKDSVFNSLKDKICLQNSLGGGGSKPTILSHPSISITKWTSTKFVQIMTLGSKLVPLLGHMFYIGLYREDKKKSSLKPQSLEPWYLCYVTSPSWPLPSLLKFWPWGTKWPARGSHVLQRPI